MFLGRVPEQVDEQQLFYALYTFGWPIVNIHVVSASRCAFVQFSDRATAELAISTLYREGLVIEGCPLTINWGKGKGGTTRAEENSSGDVKEKGDEEFQLLPPPGMEGHNLRLMHDDNGEDIKIGDRERTKRARIMTAEAHYPSMDPERLGTSSVTPII